MAGSHYAWIIDRDHLHEDDPIEGIESGAGTVGPRSARGGTRDELAAAYAHHNEFRLYDDDGIKYYTGTLFWDEPTGPDEEACYGPLGDYGQGSGCVLVKYTNHSEWDCG